MRVVSKRTRTPINCPLVQLRRRDGALALGLPTPPDLSEVDEFRPHVAPRSGENFHGMQQTVLGHPPDGHAIHAKNTRSDLLRYEQRLITQARRRDQMFHPSVDKPLEHLALLICKPAVGRQHGLKDGAACRAHKDRKISQRRHVEQGSAGPATEVSRTPTSALLGGRPVCGKQACSPYRDCGTTSSL